MARLRRHVSDIEETASELRFNLVLRDGRDQQTYGSKQVVVTKPFVNGVADVRTAVRQAVRDILSASTPNFLEVLIACENETDVTL